MPSNNAPNHELLLSKIQYFRELLEIRLTASDQDEIGTGVCQGPRRRSADAFGGARDDRRLTCERSAHLGRVEARM